MESNNENPMAQFPHICLGIEGTSFIKKQIAIFSLLYFSLIPRSNPTIIFVPSTEIGFSLKTLFDHFSVPSFFLTTNMSKAKVNCVMHNWLRDGGFKVLICLDKGYSRWPN